MYGTSLTIISRTIVAAAIIKEIIALLIAKYAFKWAGEISELNSITHYQRQVLEHLKKLE